MQTDPRRLVIVDDEPVILEVLLSIFSGEPYTVVGFSDGTAARASFERDGVDVLLTDKNLPDINGLDLIRYARAACPDVEALVITGYASLDTAVKAFELSVFDYIMKPPSDIFEVRRKVRQAFEKQRLALENRRLLVELQARNTEQEAVLARLLATQAELIQAEKLAGIGTLAAGVAHEISSPLFGVMALAEAIGDERDLAVVQQHAAEIVHYSKSIREIVVGLSGYSRAAGSDSLGVVDLSRVVSDAVRLVVRAAGQERVAVHIALPEVLYVHGQPNELQQVVVNLVKNAIEATLDADTDSPRVDVTGGVADDGVWCRVSDNGSGIPESDRSRIFDPFFTTKDPGRGTGLGLNIVYRLVTKFRGVIVVERSPSGGASFLLRFPRGA